jgi:hypothetical protein
MGEISYEITRVDKNIFLRVYEEVGELKKEERFVLMMGPIVAKDMAMQLSMKAQNIINKQREEPDRSNVVDLTF